MLSTSEKYCEKENSVAVTETFKVLKTLKVYLSIFKDSKNSLQKCKEFFSCGILPPK